jgi:xanthine dehydrogenase accessory factor
MLVTREGLAGGTIGGGKIEARALQEAREMLEKATSEPKFTQWNLQTDLGMTCGGHVKLFFETFNIARWPIVIFGAGHVAQALTRVLLPLDCHLTCLDTRQEWLEKLPDDPKLRRILTADLAAEVANLTGNSFVLLMTMGHATDLPVLRELLKRHFPYLGVIGSKSKAGALRNTLLKEGFSPEATSRFFCPMGLPLGTNHTHEIAISIAAQLLQQRDNLA